MSNLGYIALHRKIEDSFVYQDSVLLHLWIHCLLKASYTDRTIMFDGIEIDIKRGQFISGRKVLAKTLRTSEQKIRSRIALLLKHKKITQKSTNKYSVITVVKYDYYQNDGKISTNREPTENQQRTTNNKVNKVNNISETSVSVSKSPLEDNKDTMGNWNKTSDNDDDMVAIDLDTREELETKESKSERETKELNEKIRHNIKLFEPLRGIPWGTGKDMNFHVKAYRELLHSGWSHESILSAFIEIVGQPHWKEEKEKGNYPGMNTVQFHLRNKKPI